MNNPREPLRLVVTGSRKYIAAPSHFDNLMQRVLLAMDMRRQEFHVDMEGHTLSLAQGGATGADDMARKWVTRQQDDRVNLVTYPAQWSAGRGAGPQRNAQMLEEHKPELVLAIWDGSIKGSGTFHCLRTAVSMGIPVMIEPTKQGE